MGLVIGRKLDWFFLGHPQFEILKHGALPGQKRAVFVRHRDWLKVSCLSRLVLFTEQKFEFTYYLLIRLYFLYNYLLLTRLKSKV